MRTPELVEVGPRDGLQNEATPVPTALKVAMIGRLIDTGLRRIEAVSFVHPERVPQMADAEAVMAAVPRRPDVCYAGLVLNERGVDRAVEAGVDEVNAVVVATDTFGLRNQGADVQEMLRRWEVVSGRARDAGLRTTLTIAAALGCPFEGEVEPSRVAAIAASAIAASPPDELAFADTIGVGVPSGIRQVAALLTEVAGTIPLRVHLHDTRNTGIANAMAAIDAGVAALDASLGGLGGCPFAPAATGNIATEDLHYLLERSGFRTGIDGKTLDATARWFAEASGIPIASSLPRAGRFPAAD
jgi:hydroxymethylglutaryl-CoA lyase